MVSLKNATEFSLDLLLKSSHTFFLISGYCTWMAAEVIVSVGIEVYYM